MLKPRIVTLQDKKLVGRRLKMSLATDQTFDLWRMFMPEREKIGNKISSDLISMRVYDTALQIGDLNQEFDKWAAVEVSEFDVVPKGMERFVLSGGCYAVFEYKGLSTDPGIFVSIFTEWLPNSNYVLDKRPYFEVLGAKYKNNDPVSEEEIWIPVKQK